MGLRFRDVLGLGFFRVQDLALRVDGLLLQ